MSAKTALVVDDSKSARFALRRYLERQDYTVETAESAAVAQRMLRELRPDLIFLDHIMPGEDGFDVLRQLKAQAHTRSIPVVICSGNEAAAFAEEARRQDAAGVLVKPPTPEQLRRLLDALEGLDRTGSTAAARSATEQRRSAPRPSPAAASADAAPSAARIEDRIEDGVEDRAKDSATDRTADTVALERLSSQLAELSQTLAAVQAQMQTQFAGLGADAAAARAAAAQVQQEAQAGSRALGERVQRLEEALGRTERQLADTRRELEDTRAKAVHEALDRMLQALLAAKREPA